MNCFLLLILLLLVVKTYSSLRCPNKVRAPLELAFPEQIRKSISNHKRIVNGNIAKFGQFPWQVSIIYRIEPGEELLCGGSLIRPRWILTAAHCAFSATNFSIRLGSIVMSDDEKMITIETTKSIIHNHYNNRNLNNDIALIDLGRNVEITDEINTIQLPSKGEVLDENQIVEVSGWGLTTDNSAHPSWLLRYIQVKTISNSKCAEVFGKDAVGTNTVCTVGERRESTCAGDSGGGLVLRNQDGLAKLVGVVSFVAKSGCERGFPAAFVRTEPYLDWIVEHTGISLE
ncbi:brachyurin-like [Agrilus planipennis]|uniref:Brachyurin-like n=1 Tax=Agrilus planipennis TaxID=224129 RepID=A0A1W4XKY9_AGRPL|nr:brachyurin-like [Agrilus planipennis]